MTTHTTTVRPQFSNKNKRWRSSRGVLCLLFCFIMACTATAFASASSVLETAIVNNPNASDRLNLRTHPRENAPSLGRYYNGVEVDLVESVADGWARVRVGSSTQYTYGYMMAKYLAFGASGDSVSSAMPIYEVTARSLSLREGQSAGSKTVVTLGAGNRLELLGFSDNWWHMRLGTETGYISAKTTGLKLVSGDPNHGSTGHYYDGYRIAIVNNPDSTDRLNLRKTASASAASLGKYYNGVVVIMLSDPKNGWVKVRIDNLEGYMESKYLAIDARVGSVPSAMPTVTVRNGNGKNLNLRETQSQKSKSLGLYDNGTKVQVLGLTETWYHVQVDGKTGFMMADYLTPKLQYTYSENSGSGSTGGSGGTGSVDPGGTWDGPTGNHSIGQWTLSILDYVGIVNNPNPSDRLHLRTKPNEDAQSLGKYYNGTNVILCGDMDGEWVNVSIGNLTGYMKSKYLSIGAAKPPASAMPIMTVSNPNPAKNLHLREKQSVNATSLGLYENGTKVTLIGFNDEWAHVIADGQLGFMLGIYLK